MGGYEYFLLLINCGRCLFTPLEDAGKYPTDVCGRKLDSNPTQFYPSFSMDYIISGDRLGNNMQKQDPTMLHFTLIQGRRVD